MKGRFTFRVWSYSRSTQTPSINPVFLLGRRVNIQFCSFEGIVPRIQWAVLSRKRMASNDMGVRPRAGVGNLYRFCSTSGRVLLFISGGRSQRRNRLWLPFEVKRFLRS
ncbi:hypothetical protein AVEN_70194-1 [Araneus ventricosus]|uniref:Uncharacterized protein n=1 Tax=Araneus ventricosus TaxID=182803 RepID=A0A4Y2FFD1_ARAVE|nr:hypothetical protein AVEN_70194-1 [Araneus ventricosus]